MNSIGKCPALSHSNDYVQLIVGLLVCYEMLMQVNSIKAELESRSSGKDDAGPLMKMKDRCRLPSCTKM